MNFIDVSLMNREVDMKTIENAFIIINIEL